MRNWDRGEVHAAIEHIDIPVGAYELIDLFRRVVEGQNRVLAREPRLLAPEADFIDGDGAEADTAVHDQAEHLRRDGAPRCRTETARAHGLADVEAWRQARILGAARRHPARLAHEKPITSTKQTGTAVCRFTSMSTKGEAPTELVVNTPEDWSIRFAFVPPFEAVIQAASMAIGSMRRRMRVVRARSLPARRVKPPCGRNSTS